MMQAEKTNGTQTIELEQVIGIIDNHLESNQEELNETKVKFADCKLKNDHDASFKFRDRCNILQGRQEVLEVVKNAILVVVG